MRSLHRLVGFAGLLTFLATGVALRLHVPPMIDLAEGPRMLLRSRHIYILFGALVNLTFGAQYRSAAGPIRRRLQRAGSWLVLAALPLSLAAFLTEGEHAQLNGRWTPLAIVCLLAGTLLQTIAAWRTDPREP